MPTDITAGDVSITNFRAQHEVALSSRAHPEHALRTEELTRMYEQRYADPGDEVPAPDGSTSEFRTLHEDALNDRAHPEHEVRTAELTKMHERDAEVEQPAEAAGEYDFSRFKATVHGPAGVELQQDTELEQRAVGWFREAGLSHYEAEGVTSVYAESLSWSDENIAQIGQVTADGLRQKYGDSAGKAASAALRVAEDMGAREFLEATGMINHWSIVARLISAAHSKGYLS